MSAKETQSVKLTFASEYFSNSFLFPKLSEAHLRRKSVRAHIEPYALSDRHQQAKADGASNDCPDGWLRVCCNQGARTAGRSI